MKHTCTCGVTHGPDSNLPHSITIAPNAAPTNTQVTLEPARVQISGKDNVGGSPAAPTRRARSENPDSAKEGA